MGRYDALLNMEKPPKQSSNQQGASQTKYSGNPESQNTSKQDNQKTGKPQIKNSSIQEIKHTSVPEFQKPRIPESQDIAKREFYTKVTYRICDEAIDALGDAKNMLKRKFKLKVNMEEIAETAIIEACKDLAENGEKSVLVTKYSGNLESQKS